MGAQGGLLPKILQAAPPIRAAPGLQQRPVRWGLLLDCARLLQSAIPCTARLGSSWLRAEVDGPEGAHLLLTPV